MITALKGCPTIIKIGPLRPHAQDKRDDDPGQDGYTVVAMVQGGASVAGGDIEIV